MYYTSTTADNGHSGGLIAGVLANIINWNDEGGTLEFSNIFNYGIIKNPYAELSASNKWENFCGIGAVTDDHVSDFHIANVFSNIYYRPEVGGRLFATTELNGGSTYPDTYGTDRVKTVIIGKSAAEFATAETAELLNKGRRGADAPWEYIENSEDSDDGVHDKDKDSRNDYPTLRMNIVPSGGETLVEVVETILGEWLSCPCRKEPWSRPSQPPKRRNRRP